MAAEASFPFGDVGPPLGSAHNILNNQFIEVQRAAALAAATAGVLSSGMEASLLTIERHFNASPSIQQQTAFFFALIKSINVIAASFFLSS